MWGPLATLSSVSPVAAEVGGVGAYDPTAGCGSLLEILRYREPTHKHTLNDDGTTAVNNHPDGLAGTVGYQTTRRYAADGIMQRLSTAEQGRNGPPPTSSETPATVETDAFWSTSPTIPHHEGLSRVPRPGERTLNPPESPTTIPKISIQKDDSVIPRGLMVQGLIMERATREIAVVGWVM